MKPFITIIVLIPVTFIFFSVFAHAQDTTKSFAFKNNKPYKRSALLYQPDLSYQILEHLHLKQEATAGNALAQHELGIRYLMGEGEKADTIIGAYWIKQAADKKVTEAAYNYGVLCLKGMGVEWNPFLAFDYFLLAANQGMPEAQYALGSLYMDQFIVNTDLNKAYYWIKKSSESGYAPAIQILPKIRSKVDTNYVSSGKTVKNLSNQDSVLATNNNDSRSFGLVFIDFTPKNENSNKIDNKTLLEDFAFIRNADLTESLLSRYGKNPDYNIDSLDLALVLKYANNGCPEALAVLGRCYEEGKYFTKNIISALAFYLRAIKTDSPRAPKILYNIMIEKNYMNLLKQGTDKNDAEAMYVWYGLYSLGFDNSITEKDALNLLVRSASLGYTPALIELALAYYSGKFIEQDKQKGKDILMQAQKLGSLEAMVRLQTEIIFDGFDPLLFKPAFEKLSEAANNGSLLSVIALAHCYEKGKGTKLIISEAADIYRHAASRGSQYAYKELLRIYNSKRPPSDAFRIEN